MAQPRLTAWFISDGKPGHKNQLRGLAGALQGQAQVECLWLEIDGFWRFLASIRRLNRWPRPDILVAAGRKTHLPMILLRRLFGGMSVLLMRPSLPYSWFNLTVVPAHDNPPQHKTILVTNGALTDIAPATEADPGKGLILIGGSSAHYGWDSRELLMQLDSLFTAMPGISWTLTTSRRTPLNFVRQLQPAAFQHLETITLVPHQQTDRQWLLDQIASSGVIWVTEDSVSMVYEALSSGAAVGLLAMPKKSESRVSKGVQQLVQEQWVTPLSILLERGSMYSAVAPLQEAPRIAGILLHHLSKQAQENQ